MNTAQTEPCPADRTPSDWDLVPSGTVDPGDYFPAIAALTAHFALTDDPEVIAAVLRAVADSVLSEAQADRRAEAAQHLVEAHGMPWDDAWLWAIDNVA